LMMAIFLSTFMYIRVYITSTNHVMALALSISMFCIVSFSIIFGSSVPLIMTKLNFDPASSAAPVLATCMDVIGVSVTCIVSNNMLSS